MREYWLTQIYIFLLCICVILKVSDSKEFKQSSKLLLTQVLQSSNSSIVEMIQKREMGGGRWIFTALRLLGKNIPRKIYRLSKRWLSKAFAQLILSKIKSHQRRTQKKQFLLRWCLLVKKVILKTLNYCKVAAIYQQLSPNFLVVSLHVSIFV